MQPKPRLWIQHLNFLYIFLEGFFPWPWPWCLFCVRLFAYDSLPKLSWSGLSTTLLWQVLLTAQKYQKKIQREGKNWIIIWHEIEIALCDLQIQSLELLKLMPVWMDRKSNFVRFGFLFELPNLLGQLGLNFRDTWGRKITQEMCSGSKPSGI